MRQFIGESKVVGSKKILLVALIALFAAASNASAQIYFDWSDLGGNFDIIHSNDTSSSAAPYFNGVLENDGLWGFNEWPLAPSFRSRGPDALPDPSDSPEFTMASSAVLNPTKTYNIFAIVSLANAGNTDHDGTQAALPGEPWINVTQANSTEFSSSANPGDPDALPMWKSNLGTVTGITSFSVDFDDNGAGDGSDLQYSQIHGLAWKEVVAVPEPASAIMLGIGLLSLSGRRRNLFARG